MMFFKENNLADFIKQNKFNITTQNLKTKLKLILSKKIK